MLIFLSYFSRFGVVCKFKNKYVPSSSSLFVLFFFLALAAHCSVWPSRCLCSACRKDPIQTVVDLTLSRRASSLCVGLPSPRPCLPEPAKSSCGRSNRRAPSCGSASSAASSPWPKRTFSFTCTRMSKWRLRSGRVTSTWSTSRCRTCTLLSGFKGRLW